MYKCVLILTMKRNENFYSLSNKRPKLQDESIDDIWGDDPEIDDIDRCINLATQLCSQNQQQTNNNFTCYDDFKNKKNIYSSTQAFLPPNMPSTSGFVPKPVNKLYGSAETIKSSSTVLTRNTSDEEIPKLLQKIHFLESEKKKLTEMYETKNGEITILRSQLKSAQKAIDNEKMEKLRLAQENQQKWDSKLNAVRKELNTLKTELELKNLEIVNLREKLTELKKVCSSNLNLSILSNEMNASQAIFKTKANGEIKKPTVCRNIQTECYSYTFPLNAVTIYPLQNLIPHTFFEKYQEKSVFKINIVNKNLLSSYRHNFSTMLKDKTAEQVAKAEETNLISINHFYPDIQKLINCSYEELNNSKDVFNFIETIVKFTKNSLSELLNQLNNVNGTLTYDDVENMNNFYLEENENKCESFCIFSGNVWHENETAVELRRYIAVLSALVLHCKKLHKYFITSFNENEMDVDGRTEFEFLSLLLGIVTMIKNIRRSDQFCGLLSAILQLLGNISSKETLSAGCYEVITEIFKQVIFSRPSKPVQKYVAEFLKNLSKHLLFIVKLCNVKKWTTQASVKDGLLFFSEDSCALRIVSTQLETCEMNLEMSLNVMQFLVNSVTCNVFWMYYQEEQRCECLFGIYSLGIDVLFNILQKNQQDKTKVELHYTIFRIGLVFLDILTVRIPDLIVRRSRLHPQYQSIIEYISKIQKHLCLKTDHVTALENLMSQFKSNGQKMSQNKNSDNIFNNSCNST